MSWRRGFTSDLLPCYLHLVRRRKTVHARGFYLAQR